MPDDVTYNDFCELVEDDVSSNDYVDISSNDFMPLLFNDSVGSSNDYTEVLSDISLSLQSINNYLNLGFGFSILCFLFFASSRVVNRFNLKGKGVNND